MILQTQKLTKDYGSFRALDSLDLAVSPGEIVGLLGPNGSGKSTALRIVMGFLKPTAGSATLAGHDCWSESHLARRHVAYLPGELRLYENMTGRQIVDFLIRLRPGANHRDPTPMAKQFDIDLSRPLSQLSSGMKRKVALLAVLAPHMPLVILDEPTNTLDPTMRDEFLAQVRKAKEQGQAVLFSSHVLSEVEAVCDRALILRKGKLVHEEAIAPLRQWQRVEAIFATDAPEPPEGLAGWSRPERIRDRLAFDWSGPLEDLMAWLSTHRVASLRIEPIGLMRAYQRYHGAEESTRAT